ncbi:MAG: M20 family peptidase [Saccharofermentanales bacterium]
MEIAFMIAGTAAGVLIVIILFRAVRFKPLIEADEESSVIEIDQDAVIGRFQEMIRCRTISSYDVSMIDDAEFEKFRALLKRRYPLVHQSLSREELGPRGILYHWHGMSSDNPTVLMSHYDVVPADGTLWEKDPFDSVVENGEIWGRGTLDNKATLLGIMESAEYHLARGFSPANDIYLSFGGDEEIGGPSADAIVQELLRRGIKPALVLDEGGAIISSIFPGVSEEAALVGIAEKGYMDLDIGITGQGGHASSPPASTLAGKLAKIIVRLEAKPFRSRLTKPVREMIDTLGRHSSLGLRVIFANLWLFGPLLKTVFSKMGGQMNAMVRTTCAVTKLEGSRSYNVMPPRVSAGLNLRPLNGDSCDFVVKRLEKTIANTDANVKIVKAWDASAISRTDSPGWRILGKAIRTSWKGVIVSPYLMMARTDSQYFCQISENVYRFSAMRLSKDQLALIHGNNERIPVESLLKTVEFYAVLMQLC